MLPSSASNNTAILATMLSSPLLCRRSPPGYTYLRCGACHRQLYRQTSNVLRLFTIIPVVMLVVTCLTTFRLPSSRTAVRRTTVTTCSRYAGSLLTSEQHRLARLMTYSSLCITVLSRSMPVSAGQRACSVASSPWWRRLSIYERSPAPRRLINILFSGRIT